jgi:hypothetical protein
MEFHSLAEHTLFALNAYGVRHTHIYQELNSYLTKDSQFCQTDKLITRLRYRLGILYGMKTNSGPTWVVHI